MGYYKIGLAPYIVLEVLASVGFVLAFGFGNFIIFLLLSMLLGGILLGIFWRNMLEFRLSTPLEMLKNFAFVIAGFLLALPGVLSSICGLFVLIFGLVFGKNSINSRKFGSNSANFNENSHKFKENSANFSQNSSTKSEIIDVEIIEVKKD